MQSSECQPRPWTLYFSFSSTSGIFLCQNSRHGPCDECYGKNSELHLSKGSQPLAVQPTLGERWLSAWTAMLYWSVLAKPQSVLKRFLELMWDWRIYEWEKETYGWITRWRTVPGSCLVDGHNRAPPYTQECRFIIKFYNTVCAFEMKPSLWEKQLSQNNVARFPVLKLVISTTGIEGGEIFEK